VDDRGYLTGAPEWIGEISDSTESIDLNRKKLDYEKAGCANTWWRPCAANKSSVSSAARQIQAAVRKAPMASSAPRFSQASGSTPTHF